MNFKEQYFQIWTAAWNLYKKYYGVRASDERRWKELNNECESIDNQYSELPERKFVQSLLLAVIAELERSSHAEAAGAATTTQP